MKSLKAFIKSVRVQLYHCLMLREFVNKYIFGYEQCFCGSNVTRPISWVTKHGDATWYSMHYKCLTCDDTFMVTKNKIGKDHLKIDN